MKPTALLLLAVSGLFAQVNETPAPLVGAWQTSKTTSGVTYTDRATGSNSGLSGTWVQYRFLPNGRYEYSALTKQSSYNCTTDLLTFKTGTVYSKDDIILLIPLDGKFTSTDNCNRQYNYEKPIDKSNEAFKWRIERDQYGTKVCLHNDKIDGCAYKK